MRKIILSAISLLLFFLTVFYLWPESSLPPGSKVTKLVVYKSKREMLVYSGKTLLKKYTISLGGNPIGHKQHEGDSRTPEGTYTINDKNPNSGYYKNLGVSYPNQADILHARRLGRPPGGDIKIHGLPNGQGFIGKFQRFLDWTNGCLAVTNSEMEELYYAVKIGTTIEIHP